MKAWTRSPFRSLFALRVGRVSAGALLLAASACDVATGDAGSGVSPPIVQPTCASPTIDSSTIFASTGGPDRARFQLVAATPNAVFASAGTSLHRSLDGGGTWSLVDEPVLRGATVLALASFGVEIFVSVQVQEGSGLYRSTDGGETWTSAAGGGCSMPYYLTTDGTSLFATDIVGVYRWDAGNATWQALPKDDLLAFDVIESDGSYLYGNSIYVQGVYRIALDAPEAGWTQVVELPEWGYTAFAFDGDHGYAANATAVFERADAAASWKPIGELTPQINDLLIAGGAVLAATSAGLRVSTDGGANWLEVGDPMFGKAFSLATNGSSVFAASDALRRASPEDLGASGWKKLHVGADAIDALYATSGALLTISGTELVRSTDGGATWSEVGVEGDAQYLGNVVVRHDETSDTVFAVGYSSDGSFVLLSSTDDGATFHRVGPIPAGGTWVNFLAVAGGDLVVGVSGGAGVHCTDVQDITTTLYRSTDDGAHFVKDMNGFPTTFVDCYDEAFTPGITGVTEAGGVLFATTFWHGTYRSDSGGKVWTAIETPEAIGPVSSVTEIDGGLVAIASGGIVRSDDGGKSWTASGLPDLAVSSLIRADGLLLASVPSTDPAEAGLYASTDGETWSRVDASFDARVTSVVVQDGRIFAGTLDESLWSAPLACGSE